MIEPNPVEAKIELTKVRSHDREGWTICMEAEGRPEALPGTLQQTGNHLFAQGAPPTLSPDHSFGYARWIQTLKSASETAGSIDAS